MERRYTIKKGSQRVEIYMKKQQIIKKLYRTYIILGKEYTIKKNINKKRRYKEKIYEKTQYREKINLE